MPKFDFLLLNVGKIFGGNNSTKNDNINYKYIIITMFYEY